MPPKFPSSYPEHQVFEDGVTLAALAARDASGNTQADFKVIPDCSAVLAQLTLTTGATGDALDLLDVYLQTYIAGQWVDVGHFTQIIGTDANDQYFAKIHKQIATAEFEIGTALGATGIRHLLGTRWAARWTVVDGGGAGTFTWTFGLKIQPIK